MMTKEEKGYLRYVLIWFIILLVLGGGIHTYNSYVIVTTYLHGSEDVPHDVLISERVYGPVIIDGFCTDEAYLLEDTNPWDVGISSKGDSYNTCSYKTGEYPLIPVVGGQNKDEFVGDERVPYQIFISNGFAYGNRVDYFFPFDDYGNIGKNLGDCMGDMANMIGILSFIRALLFMPLMDVYEVKAVFDASSDEDKITDGKYQGQYIDFYTALEYTVFGIPQPPPPPPCTTCGWMTGAIFYPLLLTDD